MAEERKRAKPAKPKAEAAPAGDAQQEQATPEAQAAEAAADAPEAAADAPQPEAPQAAAEAQPAGAAQEPAQAVAQDPAASGGEEPPPSAAEQPQPAAAEQPEAAAEAPEPGAPAERAPASAAQDGEEAGQEREETAPARVKPSVPGAHLEVDIVPEGADPLGRGDEESYEDPYALVEAELAPAEAGGEAEEEAGEEVLVEPIATAAIDLAAGARYRATGKRKTAIARVTLRPGKGTYEINGRTLEEHFPRTTLQRNIRQPLETVGYHERMDVVARLQGGGISAQAGALRHGVSRALLEADPNLRGELKRRGFLTRDSRAKERKKAGLKKARKRPQFSKR
jgi:small subunit ribosomal protein S9